MSHDTLTKLSPIFYRSFSDIRDADSGMWSYLCNLIPARISDPQRAVRDALSQVSPELRRYYHARYFAWERMSGGLESCFFRSVEDICYPETIQSFRDLGAHEHARIIEELLPLVADRQRKETAAIEEAERRGIPYDQEDDGFWEPWEERWDAADTSDDYVSVIWEDVQMHPDRYAHSRE